MNFRNAVKAIFGGIKRYVMGKWQEIGSYTARFSYFGKDIYANDVVRACIRTLSEHSAKANVKVIRNVDGVIKEPTAENKRIQHMIQYRPNMYMNGKDFLAKVRTTLEINNVVFIYINRDKYGRVTGLYPMPHGEMEAVEVQGQL